MWRSIFSNFAVRVLSALLNLGIVILVSRLTGAVGKGEQSLLLTTIALITILDSLVGGAALVYLSSRYSWKQLLVASYLWVVLISGLSYFSLTILGVFKPEYLVHVLVLSALSSLAAVHASLLLGKRLHGLYNLIQLVVPVLTILVCLLQWNLDQQLNYRLALYWAFGISFFVSAVLLLLHFERMQPVTTLTKVFKQLMQYGFYNQLAHVLQLLSFRLTYYILVYFKGEAAVGQLSNASSITESIWMIATSISLWQYAFISNSEDQSLNVQITEKLTRFGMLAALIGALFFLFLPASFYTAIFGPDFGILSSLMWALAPGVWLFTYALVVGHYFSGQGRYQINALASGVGLIVCVISAYVMIPIYGVMGAAFASSCSYVATSAVVMWYFQQEGAQLSFFPRKADWKEFAQELRVYLQRSK
ncbi:MAG: hypothetical protein RLZZ301_1538 [Bacteroidota bacterium]|jgi:O-antigen/teichoic acid export membrane protein